MKREEQKARASPSACSSVKILGMHVYFIDEVVLVGLHWVSKKQPKHTPEFRYRYDSSLQESPLVINWH